MIGVVIAVRDQVEFLGEALDSLAAQTLPCAEIVVVDDASVDGSGELARERGIKTITADGQGPAIARNIGVRATETEFIRILDGDDRFTAPSNELLLAAIADAPAVCGQVREFFDPARAEELAAHHKIATEPATGVPTSMLIRRSVFDSIGGFSEVPGEHDFFGFIKALGEVPSIEQVVAERRIHGNNRTILLRDEIQRQYLRSARAAILASRSQGEK